MVDTGQYLQLLSSLVYRHGKATLLELFNQKLLNERTEIHKLLEDERHTLYHAYENGHCCECLNLTNNNKKKTYLGEEQWANLYEIQKRKSCKSKKKCICQYGVVTNVNVSAFDITTLITLLLHFKDILKISTPEINEIHLLRKHRNSLTHSDQSNASLNDLKIKCNDITVAIRNLARSCKYQFALETEEKIKLEKEVYDSASDIEGVVTTDPDNGLQITVVASATTLEEVVHDVDTHFVNSRQQSDEFNIDTIRTRLSITEYRRRLQSRIDPVQVIDHLHNKGVLNDSDRQSLVANRDRRLRSEKLLQILLSRDDADMSLFMKSLLETNQQPVFDYIIGNDNLGKLHVVLTSDIPLNHPSGFDVVVKIELTGRQDLQNLILDAVRKEEKFGNMKVQDKYVGSVIIHLRPETPYDNAEFTKAYYNGTLRELVEQLLERAGILDELIKDQVKVVVNISVAGTEKANKQETIYEEHWDYLLEQMSPTPLAEMLLQKGLLNQDDKDDILRHQSRLSQSNTLLSKLNANESETYQRFMECLSLCSQDYIVQTLQGQKMTQVEIPLKEKPKQTSGQEAETGESQSPDVKKKLTVNIKQGSIQDAETSESQSPDVKKKLTVNIKQGNIQDAETSESPSPDVKKKLTVNIKQGSIQDAETMKQDAEMIRSVQVVCRYHSKVSAFLCIDCDDLVCTICIKTIHKRHEIIDIHDTIPIAKQKCMDFIAMIENKEIPRIKEILREVGEDLKMNQTFFQSQISLVIKRNITLKEKLDNIAETFIKTYRKTEHENSTALLTYQKDMQTKLEELLSKIEQVKSCLVSENDAMVYNTYKSIPSKIEDLPKPACKMAEFTSGQLQSEQICTLFGGTKTSSLIGHFALNWRVASIFTPYKGQIPKAIHAAGDRAWISFVSDKKMLKADQRGNVIQSMITDVRVKDFCISPTTRHIWYCSADDNNATEVSEGNTVVRFATNTNPTCICVTRDNHVIIGYTGQLVKYTLKGQGICRTSLMEYPYRVTECPLTGNVAVADWDRTHSGSKNRVVVLNDQLQVLYAYIGELSGMQSPQKEFIPNDVCFTNTGEIIIADGKNMSLLLVTGNGNYLKTLYSHDGAAPLAVCVHNDALWVSFWDGKVQILTST